MTASYIWTSLIFFVIIFGLAAPLTRKLALDPPERLVATAAFSILGVFLFSGLVFVWNLPAGWLWALPALSAAGLAMSAKLLREEIRTREFRDLIVGQFLVTAWCVGWLALVVSYSGGGWTGDWFEHWERARFFMERWPRDTLFLGIYPLTARPPLANVVTGTFLQLSRNDFSHYQIFSTLFSSLVFLPGALLARRFGGRRAVAVFAVLLMLNPLFVQNATFAWTKLPAAFFALTALYFFLRAHDEPALQMAGPIFAACLAAGLITHYSTGPYAVLLGLAWLAFGWKRRRESAWWRTTAVSALVGASVLATWFGWSLINYGTDGTFFSNSSITTLAAEQISQFTKILLNLRDTLVPHFLRPLDEALLAQQSHWGRWRDWWFQLYQLNLFFALGSTGWLIAIVTLVRERRNADRRPRVFWSLFIPALVILGVAVHGARDTWGLTHICLQPLILLGLTFLAAKWEKLSQPFKWAVAAGAGLDFAFGIMLHFSVQNHAPAFWFANAPADDLLTGYNGSATMNYAAKLQHQTLFLNDVFTASSTLVLALLGGLLIFALIFARANTRRAD